MLSGPDDFAHHEPCSKRQKVDKAHTPNVDRIIEILEKQCGMMYYESLCGKLGLKRSVVLPMLTERPEVFHLVNMRGEFPSQVRLWRSGSQDFVADETRRNRQMVGLDSNSIVEALEAKGGCLSYDALCGKLFAKRGVVLPLLIERPDLFQLLKVGGEFPSQVRLSRFGAEAFLSDMGSETKGKLDILNIAEALKSKGGSLSYDALCGKLGEKRPVVLPILMQRPDLFHLNHTGGEFPTNVCLLDSGCDEAGKADAKAFLRDNIQGFIQESLAAGGKTVQELSNALSAHFNRPNDTGKVVNVLKGLVGKPKHFFLQCNYLRVTEDGPGGGFVELA